MQINVSGKQIDIGSALQEYVSEKIEQGVTKYFDRAVKAEVVFSKESHLNRADILVNEGTGTQLAIRGHGEADEIYVAFDIACERIEKQLRRYKRRLKSHNKEKLNNVVPEATQYVLADNEEESTEEDNPLIIAEQATDIEHITVSEAVMRMDLGDLPALMFVNSKTNSISVVYRRNDGNVSWIDSKKSVAS